MQTGMTARTGLSDAPLGDWYGVTTDTDGRVMELSLADNKSDRIAAG